MFWGHLQKHDVSYEASTMIILLFYNPNIVFSFAFVLMFSNYCISPVLAPTWSPGCRLPIFQNWSVSCLRQGWRCHVDFWLALCSFDFTKVSVKVPKVDKLQVQTLFCRISTKCVPNLQEFSCRKARTDGVHVFIMWIHLFITHIYYWWISPCLAPKSFNWSLTKAFPQWSCAWYAV